ncbi:MFS transporter [Nocardioides KLBMP 9356]|uniref:MFS transporter n=1 Tax=Nocardioides potassii TaxID=2911371 RepID=A0ABS9HD19_9ACTN|nr:MFS transporter [Nocardioides potassii]MCF6378109.1 MFS transporter [Nocardioides potassii]
MTVSKLPLAVLCSAQFVLILDVAVVNVALVPLSRDLVLSPDRLQILSWSYALAFGLMLLPGGRFADVGRRRWSFCVGLSVFAASSALAGAAGSLGTLAVARVLQGVGAGIASPAALALLTAAHPGERDRARALGVWAAVAAAGGAAGLVIGGLLTESFGWRSVFWVNVPVVAGVVVLAQVVLPPDGVARRWRDAGALVPRLLWRTGSVVVANAVVALMSAVVVGTNFVLAIHLQGRLELSPVETGMAFLPMTAVSTVSAWWAAGWVGRMPAHQLLAGGMFVLALGCACLSRLPADGGYLTSVLLGMALVAAGMGPGFALGTLVAVADVPQGHHGAAAAVLSASTQLGAALGLAGLEVVAATAAAPAVGLRRAFVAMTAAALAAALIAALFPARGTQQVANAEAPVAFASPAPAAGCTPGCVRASSFPHLTPGLNTLTKETT